MKVFINQADSFLGRQLGASLTKVPEVEEGTEAEEGAEVHTVSGTLAGDSKPPFVSTAVDVSLPPGRFGAAFRRLQGAVTRACRSLGCCNQQLRPCCVPRWRHLLPTTINLTPALPFARACTMPFCPPLPTSGRR
jgi:hypothetical protein